MCVFQSIGLSRSPYLTNDERCGLGCYWSL